MKPQHKSQWGENLKYVPRKPTADYKGRREDAKLDIMVRKMKIKRGNRRPRLRKQKKL